MAKGVPKEEINNTKQGISMNFYGDYHVHTLNSDGRGSVEEMVMAADSRGLQEIGLADHGPNNIGTGVRNDSVFAHIKDELAVLGPKYPGLRILASAEADVISLKGDLDLKKEAISVLDYLIVGLHPFVIPLDLKSLGWLFANQLSIREKNRERVKTLNTKALKEAVYKHEVWAVSHPGLKMDINIPEVAKACAANGTLWEINAGHKHPSYHEVMEASRFGVDFVVNSDAHFPESVGSLEYGEWVLKKANLPVERVYNAGSVV